MRSSSFCDDFIYFLLLISKQAQENSFPFHCLENHVSAAPGIVSLTILLLIYFRHFKCLLCVIIEKWACNKQFTILPVTNLLKHLGRVVLTKNQQSLIVHSGRSQTVWQSCAEYEPTANALLSLYLPDVTQIPMTLRQADVA